MGIRIDPSERRVSQGYPMIQTLKGDFEDIFLMLNCQRYPNRSANNGK